MSRRQSREISRRTFLRGAGATVALPWLPSLAPRSAWAQDAAPPKRFLAWFAPNGIFMPNWTPEQEGPLQATPILEPLAGLLDQALILTGIGNKPGIPDGSGNHAAGTASFLTATHVKRTEGANLRNAKSADQLIADKIGGDTRFPSLQVGVQGGKTAGSCDAGYSCAYNRNVSWSSPATPLHKEINPKTLFDRLFGGDDPTATLEQIERRKVLRLSVLDFVRDDIAGLKTKLGSVDGRKLDEYLAGLREFERQLAANDGSAECAGLPRPGEPDDLRHHVKLMSDLIAVALRCDMSRVVSFMLGNGGGNQVFPFLGFNDGHHLVSHHMGNPAVQAKYTQICTWQMEELAYLLTKLQSIEEADGTSLLDNTLCYFSSDVEDGNTHSHVNLPIMLVGKLGGAVTPGRHVVYPDKPPLANLLLGLVRLFGVDADGFGDDSTGPLEGLA